MGGRRQRRGGEGAGRGEAPAAAVPRARAGGRARLLVAAVVLVVAVAAIFAHSLRFDFHRHLDDDLYLTENAVVQRGLDAAGVAWAVRTTHASNWHPLTWLSHMADVQLWGMRAGGHRLTNLLLHAAGAVLLCALLAAATGAFWRPAAVALLFAVHPLHVESVVWVSERKDVLSTLLLLLALAAWLRHARTRGSAWYAAALVAFACGLMAKPMIVTLPFLLLLLDYWPLGRRLPLKALLLEKAPFFLLSAASSAATFLAQRGGGSVRSFEQIPIAERVANALLSYGAYLAKTVWPLRLVPFYPHPGGDIPPALVAAAAALLAAVTVAAVRHRTRLPFLAVGWLWYLGTLVPVIGLVQVGAQAMADRYTYVPLIGVFVAAAWGLPQAARSAAGRRALCAAAAVALALLAALARHQVGIWRDDLTLLTTTLLHTRDNFFAHTNLGNLLQEAGRSGEALGHYREAIRINPGNAVTRNAYGVALYSLRRYGEAAEHLNAAVRMKPDFALAHMNLGNLLDDTGRPLEAIEHYRLALRHDPESPRIQYNLGLTLERIGRYGEALAAYRETVRIDPRYPDAAQAVRRVSRLAAAGGTPAPR